MLFAASSPVANADVVGENLVGIPAQVINSKKFMSDGRSQDL